MSSRFEPPVRDLHRLRRYTFWSIVGSSPFALFLALTFLAASGSPGPRLAAAAAAACVATGATAAALVLFMRDGSGRVQRRLAWLGLGALLAGAALSHDADLAAWVAPAGLLFSVPVLRARPGVRWRLALYGTLAAVAAALALVWLELADSTLPFLTGMVFPAVMLGVVCQWWNYAVALELEHSRELAAELAVAEERLRFAAELHDVNGGHLQAIVLKAQLARRLVEVRPEEAARELEAIEELSRATLKDTRAVVGGYRQVSLSDEIASAARILGSAGVRATVDADVPELEQDRQRLLGLLVREGTTNLLRHAEATEASLRVEAADGSAIVAIANDGAGEASGSGNGLSMLAERFAAAGGAVEHRREGGRFVLTGSLPLEVEA